MFPGTARSGDPVKGTFAIKRNGAELIEAGIADKGFSLVRNVNQPESPAAGIMKATRDP